MKQRALAELLSQYLDDLGVGVDNAESYLAVFPRFRQEIGPLLQLSRRLRGTLTPLEPSPTFARNLESRLVAAWHENKVRDEDRRREWWIRIAAVGSLISVAAIAAVVARSRGQLIPVPDIKLR